MNFTLDITWMPRRWNRSSFRWVEGWHGRQYGPGEGAWKHSFGLVLGRVLITVEITRYAP